MNIAKEFQGIDYLVIAVTADEYEIILGVEKTAAALERTMKLPTGSVNAAIHSKNASGKISGMRFFRIPDTCQ